MRTNLRSKLAALALVGAALGGAAAVLGAGGLAPAAAAAERTVILSVENMWCASCVYIVKRTLAGVTGVSDVVVTAVDENDVATTFVTFDDDEAGVEDLINATFEIGYPSNLVE